ncbi:unnamed protein product [Effrenium voratum]|nr:unnamed protein product [Effrenium voratum]
MTDVPDPSGPGEASCVSQEVFRLAAGAKAPVRAISYEAEDAQVLDVYSLLGGRSRLVDPVLQGHSRLVCCYGRSEMGLQLLGDLFRAAASDMMSGAARQTSERLVRLGVSLLECRQQEDSATPSWTDEVAGRPIDPSTLDDNALVSTSQPLLQCFESVGERIRGKTGDAGESRHFAIELSAAHANEMGALAIVFLASPANVEAEATELLVQHAKSLRHIAGVVHRPRTGFGVKPASVASCSQDETMLLLLSPKANQSLASHVAAECLKMKDGAANPVSEMNQPKLSNLPLTVHKLYQPSGVIAWGCPDAQSPSPTCRNFCKASIPSPSPVAPATPRTTEGTILQRIAEAEGFDVDAWRREAQQNGRPFADQVSDLAQVVIQLQDLLRVVVGQVKLPSPAVASWTQSRRSADATINEAISPRVAVSSPFATPCHVHSMASTGNLVACSPRNPVASDLKQRAEASGSPLTRSCSANYPVGSLLSKGSIMSVLGEVQSPKAVMRDLSPSELRFLHGSPQPPPPPPGVQQHRSLVPRRTSPLQPAMMSVPSPGPAASPAQSHGISVSQDGHVLQSPRTAQCRERGAEGQRSPMPFPPQHKAVPHSARAAGGMGPGIVIVPGQTLRATTRGTESISNLRWEPSPVRVRFVAGAAQQVQLPATFAPHGGGQALPQQVAFRVGELRACPSMSPPKIA